MPVLSALARLLTAATLPLLVVLTACAQPAAPPQAPPDELARFHDQDLVFGPCADYATTALDEQVFAIDPRFECARLEVPLDHAEPDGGTAQIALLRVPARGEKIGSLLLNSGGPGGAGMVFAAGVSRTLATSPITERFDLVGFDPRGVGASIPTLDCYTPEELAGGAVQNEFIVSAGAWTGADTAALVEQCAQRSGGAAALASSGTRDVVRDMDVLREVLGDPQLSFLGQSYGTRMGSLYAQEFPQNVRALVLDGAIDPDLATADRRLSQFAGFQRSFDVFAADCATRPDCPLGTDPAGATRAFQEIVRPLVAAPVPGPDGRQLTFDEAVGGVLSALYSQENWPRLTAALAEVRSGRGDDLLRIGDEFAGEGNYGEATYAIGCMDEERLTPDQAVDLRARIYAATPILDAGLGTAGARDGCESWPAPPQLTYPFPDDVDGLPPTLTISITGDPSTPYDAGVRLADALGGSVLTVEGEQHTILSLGTSACVNDVAAAYLVDLVVPPADARCAL